MESWRLLLIIIRLDNQSDDCGNDHAELKQSFPCNHNHHPLSCDRGQRSITPVKSRGTAYRGTGSTVDRITHLAPDCKKIRPAGIPPRLGFHLFRALTIEDVIANQCAHWCGNPLPHKSSRHKILLGERIATPSCGMVRNDMRNSTFSRKMGKFGNGHSWEGDGSMRASTPTGTKSASCRLQASGKTVTKYRREEGIFPAVYHFPGESKHYFQILPDFFGKNVAFSDFRWYNDDGSLGAALCCPFSKK